MKNPLSWWRALSQHPVYLREKGLWGKPNPFYENLRRFSPFVVMGSILFGVCAGAGNPALFPGNDDWVVFGCFLCLPGMFLSALTLFGSLMAPALTAPAISVELAQGTWDILRVTPLPTRSILLAKLFGALTRLRVFWWLLFAMSLFQGLIVACSASLAPGPFTIWGWLLGISAAIRPWLEVLFAALAGLYVSTWTRSATAALVGSYTGVVLVKALNNSLAWIGLSALFNLDKSLFLLSGLLLPTAVYAVITPALWLGLMRAANKLEY